MISIQRTILQPHQNREAIPKGNRHHVGPDDWTQTGRMHRAHSTPWDDAPWMPQRCLRAARLEYNDRCPRPDLRCQTPYEFNLNWERAARTMVCMKMTAKADSERF